MGRLTGIVLAGGQSTRMGRDKAFIERDSRYLYLLAAEQLSLFCDEVFISLNQDQSETHVLEWPIITDTYVCQGPMGGLMSALESLRPPFLIMATDLLHVQQEHIARLLQVHRQHQGFVSYYNTESQYFEPMLSVWDEAVMEEARLYFEQGGRSFQKFLKNSKLVSTLPCDDCRFLHNANTPESLDF